MFGVKDFTRNGFWVYNGELHDYVHAIDNLHTWLRSRDRGIRVGA
jgi:hypothetical protein